MIAIKIINKKITTFFLIVILSLSYFFQKQYLPNKKIQFKNFLSFEEEDSENKNKIVDERWEFSLKEQIAFFVIIFIIFVFVLTFITKRNIDINYDASSPEKRRDVYFTRLYYKDILCCGCDCHFLEKIFRKKVDENIKSFRALEGGGRKYNLWGNPNYCCVIEFIVYFLILYNVFFFVLDLLIFPIIIAFDRKKKKEKMTDCLDNIISNKFYFKSLEEEGYEFFLVLLLNPFIAYVFYRLIMFIVIFLFFDKKKLNEIAKTYGAEITKLNTPTVKTTKNTKSKNEKNKEIINQNKATEVKVNQGIKINEMNDEKK